MKYGIIGSINSISKQQVYAILDRSKNTITQIISDGANGISYVEQYAKTHNIPYTIYKPDFSDGRYVKQCFIRNRRIVDNSDIILAFWNGENEGTKYTLEYANEQGKETIIIGCNQNE